MCAFRAAALRSFFVVLLAFCSFNAQSQTITLSPVELIQSVIQYLGDMEDAAVQLETQGIMNGQLATQIEDLYAQWESLEQQYRNLESWDGKFTHQDEQVLLEQLGKTFDVIDHAITLDPRNPTFNDVLRGVMDDAYSLPSMRTRDVIDDPETLAHMEKYEDGYRQEYEDGERLLRREAVRDEMADDRRSSIDEFSENIDALGAESELETQQITASQTNLMLRQQEEIIGRLDDINRREQRRDMDEASARREAHEKFLTRVQEKKTRRPYGVDLVK